MTALDQRLVRRDRGLVQLLDPPFDKGDLNPGYIKGYLPGIRENGGQYTHAAIWATMAFADLGDKQRAWEMFGIINPVNHAKSATAVARYKVEPYVAAADVYALSPHIGRGGWTWYTGSAGWMYRLITESLLGLRLEVDKLHLEPCLPVGWEGFTDALPVPRDGVSHQRRARLWTRANDDRRAGAGERRDSDGGRRPRSTWWN